MYCILICYVDMQKKFRKYQSDKNHLSDIFFLFNDNLMNDMIALITTY